MDAAAASALERAAAIAAEAGRHDEAASLLGVLAVSRPDDVGLAIRHAAALAQGEGPEAAAALARLAAIDSRPLYDDALFSAVHHLLDLGAVEGADALVARAADHAPDMLAAARARVLAARGHRGRAMLLLAPAIAGPRPGITALRVHYLLAGERGDLDAAIDGAARTARLYGQARDVTHACRLLLALTDADPAAALVAEVAPGEADLAAQAAAAQAELAGALAAEGPADDAPLERIRVALTAAGQPAARVVWARRALVLALRAGRIGAGAFADFGLYLPNWEDGQVRGYVLHHASAAAPADAGLRLARLRRLMQDRAWGDAALALCAMAETEGPMEDAALYALVMLLRLAGLGLVPGFLDTTTEAALRGHLAARIAGASAGLRAVLHPHLVATGLPEPAWPDGAGGPGETGADAAFRRLFALAPGRAAPRGRVPRPGTPPPRPVLAISGQLRGFETAWRETARHLASPFGAPVVMTVWSTSRNALGRHAGRLERALPADIIADLPPAARFTDSFAERYPRTAALVFGETAVDPDRLAALIAAEGQTVLAAEVEEEALIARLHPPLLDRNMLKMFYKIARAEQLIRAAEQADGRVFTHVIWTRPDCEVTHLPRRVLAACLARSDVAYSSWVTDASFGDYTAVLPRAAFAAIAGVWPRVAAAGSSEFWPWRPPRDGTPGQPYHPAAFGGPDTLFDVLLAGGWFPLARIAPMRWRLLGRAVDEAALRAVFAAEGGA